MEERLSARDEDAAEWRDEPRRLGVERMKQRNLLYERGTRSHYENAEYYDQAYRRRRADIDFYAEMASRFGGPVLELGAGTGRVSRAIAEQGVEILGIDSSEPMLERAERRRKKMRRAARELLEFAHGDLLELRLGRKFPLVIAPFNVFMHLYDREEFQRAMDTVRAHLAPGGVFVFDVLVPDLRALLRDPDRLYSAGTVSLPGRGRRYKYKESFNYDPIAQVLVITLYFQSLEDPEEILTQTIAHRQFFPAELEAILHYEGFEILERYGDFEREPLLDFAESQVLVTRLGATPYSRSRTSQ